MPSLGLSNKAVYENDNKEAAKVKNKEIYPNESHFTATILTGIKRRNLNVLSKQVRFF